MYAIRVDGPADERALYLPDDTGGEPTSDKKLRAIFEYRSDAMNEIERVAHSCGLEGARIVKITERAPRFEQTTTHAEFCWNRDPEHGGGSWSVPDPVEPDGPGWRLVGVATGPDGLMIFAWERPSGARR